MDLDVVDNGEDDNGDSYDDNNENKDDKNNNNNSTDDSDTIFGDDSSGSNINNIPVTLQTREAVSLYDDNLISVVKLVNYLKRKWNRNGNIFVIDDNEQMNTNGNVVVINDDDSVVREIVGIDIANDSNKRCSRSSWDTFGRFVTKLTYF